MWMLVNITIFGDGAVINDMVVALNAALLEMRTKYCDTKTTFIQAESPDVQDKLCDLEEIENAGEWM